MFANIFELAAAQGKLQGADVQSLLALYHITSDIAACRVGPELAAKYNVAQDNRQLMPTWPVPCSPSSASCTAPGQP